MAKTATIDGTGTSNSRSTPILNQTGTSTTPDDETSSLNLKTSVSGLNLLNLVAYVINVAVTYGIGMAGILGQPTNQEMSLKYQTLVTPIGWSFSIWGLIFLSQLVWAIYPMASRTQRSSDFVTAVGVQYALVVLMQAVWSVSFSYDIIWLTIISISLVLVFLWNIVDRLERMEPKNGTPLWEYILWFFPFTLHCGWITVATALNYNVILMHAGKDVAVQYAAAIGTLMILVVVAWTWLLRDTPDYVIPLVLAYGGVGIYFELADPVDAIVNNFETSQIQTIKGGALIVTFLVVVGCGVRNLITLCFLSAKYKTPAPKKKETDEEDNNNNYTRAPEQENETDVEDNNYTRAEF